MLRRLRPRTSPGPCSLSLDEGRSGERGPSVSHLFNHSLLSTCAGHPRARGGGSEMNKTQPCLHGSWFNRGNRLKKQLKSGKSGKGIARNRMLWVVLGRCESGKTSWKRWCLRTDGISQVKGIPHERSNLNRGLQAGDGTV